MAGSLGALGTVGTVGAGSVQRGSGRPRVAVGRCVEVAGGCLWVRLRGDQLSFFWKVSSSSSSEEYLVSGT